MTDKEGVQVEAPGMRERVLSEAASRFVIHGYNGISMREIAEACGISKAALYYHFKDKEDLLLAILDRYLEQMDRLIRDSRQRGGTAHQQLSGVVQAIFSQVPEQRSIIRLATQEMPNLSGAARQRFGLVYHMKFIGQFEEILALGVENGEFKPLDVHLTVWVLLGMMYPFFYPAPERQGLDVEKALNNILDIFFEGIVPRES
jgi:AcrR family transcriptional regulator